MNLFQQILQKLVKQFTRNMNRGPNTPFEWMEIQNEAVRMLNKTKGVPSGPKKPWHQGWKPKIIEGGKKPAEGIPGLLEKGKEKSFMEEMIDRGHKAIKPGTREYDEYMKKTRWHKKSIDDLIKSGDVQVGKTPKTKKITLDSKKEKLQAKIEEELWIKRKVFHQDLKNHGIKVGNPKLLKEAKNQPKEFQDY